MAQAVPYIMLAATAYSIKTGLDAASQQEQAAADAERIGRENAAIIEAETREEKKRMLQQQEQESGSARSKALAAGVLVTGSAETYLSDLDTAQQDAVDWLVKSGKNRERIAINTGQYTAAQGRAGASTTRAGVAANLASSTANIYTAGKNANWFDT